MTVETHSPHGPLAPTYSKRRAVAFCKNKVQPCGEILAPLNPMGALPWASPEAGFHPPRGQQAASMALVWAHAGIIECCKGHWSTS